MPLAVLCFSEVLAKKLFEALKTSEKVKGARRVRPEAKILCQVKGTGARQCSKNNRKLIIVVLSDDLARLST